MFLPRSTFSANNFATASHYEILLTSNDIKQKTFILPVRSYKWADLHLVLATPTLLSFRPNYEFLAMVCDIIKSFYYCETRGGMVLLLFKSLLHFLQASPTKFFSI